MGARCYLRGNTLSRWQERCRHWRRGLWKSSVTTPRFLSPEANFRDRQIGLPESELFSVRPYNHINPRSEVLLHFIMLPRSHQRPVPFYPKGTTFFRTNSIFFYIFQPLRTHFTRVRVVEMVGDTLCAGGTRVVNAFERVFVGVKGVMCTSMQEVVHLGAKQVGINTCREIIFPYQEGCVVLPPISCHEQIYYLIKAPPPTRGKGFREY